MTTLVVPAPASRRSEYLVIVAVLALFVFYYGLRADLIGVTAPGRGWFPMTPGRIPVGVHFVGSGIILGLVPMLLARRFTGKSVRELGWGLGDRRAGAGWLLLGIPLAVLGGRIASASAAMGAVYPLDPTLDGSPGPFAAHSALQLVYYIGWETLFRGVLLFGMADRWGERGANFLQTALSVLAHFGRPMDETFSAVPFGLIFGAVALRTRSIWAVTIIHWTVGVALNAFLLL